MKYGKARRPAWRTLAFVWSAIARVGRARAATLFSRFEFSLAPPAMPAALWPPSRESTPFLATVLAASLVACYRVFFRVAQSEAAQAVKAKKARLVLAQLAQTVRMERERAEQEARLAAGGALGGEADAERKVPPTAAALHELLYDTTEERHVTEFGIEASRRRPRGLPAPPRAAERSGSPPSSPRGSTSRRAPTARSSRRRRGGRARQVPRRRRRCASLKLYTREVRRHFAQPLRDAVGDVRAGRDAETERLAATRAHYAAIDAEQRGASTRSPRCCCR